MALSGGQQQLLAIAAAIVMEPRILVMDEPTSNLDPMGTTEVFDVAQRLNRDTGVTVVIAEHEVEALARYADRIVVLMPAGSSWPAPRRACSPRSTRWQRSASGRRRSPPWPMLSIPRPSSCRSPRGGADLVRRAGVTDPRAPVASLDDVRLVYSGWRRGPRRRVARSRCGVGGRGGRSERVWQDDLQQAPQRPAPPDERPCPRRRSGHRPVHRAALARRVGYVFQDPAQQLFARTVADELAFGPRNLGYPPADVASRVAAVVDALDLTGVLGTHPYRLPMAGRKLVSIGAVLTMGPRVVVLDEPTTGQDHRTSARIAAVVGGQRDAGTTLVCVTHDMSLVAEVGDRPWWCSRVGSRPRERLATCCRTAPCSPPRHSGRRRSASCRSSCRVAPGDRLP